MTGARPESTLLIANRGEVAVRIARTARRLGLRTVAIFTDLDAGAPHVAAADEAVPVSSYLDIDAVIAACHATSVDAVHPGYGFLSERAAFAAALDRAGITLVGPSASVIALMGRKDAARAVAIEAGLPVVPSWELGSSGEAPPIPQEQFPVLVKAAAGGGGKGMRIVHSANQLDEAMATARREAAAAFGDDTLLIEAYIASGRHIEVQVMADHHGTVLHLLDRDCSTQRRHQKVIEEAPASSIPDTTRGALTDAAVALARQVDYVGAGTVEFLVDADTGNYYFLEMNTRLQVEHPVTEMITGLDIVELQLRVAAGEPLRLDQTDVRQIGHAIEARIYAEDPCAGFLPQAGRATLVEWPDRLDDPQASVRVDQALVTGQSVGTSYDPMLGKIIVYALTREQARIAAIEALDATTIHGLTTNVGFARRVLASEAFRDSTIDTAWLDRPDRADDVLSPPDRTTARTLAAWALFESTAVTTGAFCSDGFRLGAPAVPPTIELDEPVTLARSRPPLPRHSISGGTVQVTVEGQRFAFEMPDPARPHDRPVGDGSIAAPMPGTLTSLHVRPGDRVAEGQVMGVLEAMKMEFALRAPFDGVVVAITGATGSRVALGTHLFEVERTADDAVEETV